MFVCALKQIYPTMFSLLSIKPTTENVFRECYNSFYLSRGGGVVIALASRSHRH